MKDFLRIGEVSSLCNISIKTLRFYEEKGLIKPIEVDPFTGYRHYNEKNVKEIYKIQFLKEAGFSLDEIKNFDENSLSKKVKNLKKEINNFKKKISLISSYTKTKGDIEMKPFINDEKVIGKWKYDCSCNSKEEYYQGEYIKEDIALSEICFLPKGEGYWVFDRWTKGELYSYNGIYYTYEVEGDLLFLTCFGLDREKEICLVYKRVDNKAHTVEELARKDEINLPIEKDENVVGFWNTYDYIPYNMKNDYQGEKIWKESIFITSLIFTPDNKCLMQSTDKIFSMKYTNGKLLSEEWQVVMDYEIKVIGGEEYLILDWKSRDYTYTGRINGCYVLKRA